MQKSISYFQHSGSGLRNWVCQWINDTRMYRKIETKLETIARRIAEYIQYTYKKSRTKILHYHRRSQLKSCGVYVHEWVRKPQTNYFFFLQKNVSERVCPRDILTKYFFHPKRMMISQVFICLRGLGAWCEKLYSFFLERREFQSIF